MPVQNLLFEFFHHFRSTRCQTARSGTDGNARFIPVSRFSQGLAELLKIGETFDAVIHFDRYFSRMDSILFVLIFP
jgi:hypothetical protein